MRALLAVVVKEPSVFRGLFLHLMLGYSAIKPLHLGDRPGT
jgi:hypothetical protein